MGYEWTAGSTVLRLVVGAARLDARAYAAIAADRAMGVAAVLVVALSAIAHAVTGVIFALEGGWAPIRSIVPAAVSQVVIWLVMSVVAFGVGRALGGQGTLGGILRSVGVASLAALLYVFGWFPPVLVVMLFYWLATTFVAIRGALALDAGRAAVALIVAAVIGVLVTQMGTLLVLDLLAAAGYPG